MNTLGKQIKKKFFVLFDDRIRDNAIGCISKLELGKFEVDIRPITKDKTLKQLGGIFGVWIKYIADENGESEPEVHKRLKAEYLARVYAIGPEGKFKDEQESWLDSITLHQVNGDKVKLKRAVDRLSLRWASLNQTKIYMNAINQGQIAIGQPLPELDRFYKCGGDR